MKWIGQHIWSFISRFRNDIYMEDVSSGTIASGSNLGLDSNNKVVKATITSADTTYAISCVDGDNSDEEKIRLTAGGSGSGTDDVVLEAGTGLSIARSGDKITFTNTVTDTDTILTTEQVQDIAGALVATGGTKTLISVTYDDANNNMDFVVDNDLSNYDNSSSGFITSTLTTEQVQDIVGGMLVGTETRIGVSYDDVNGRIDFVVDDMTADTNTQNSYAISCVDGDNSDEEKIRLTQSGADGAATDDVVLEAGTGLSIARSGDKITFTNTVSDTDTNTQNTYAISCVDGDNSDEEKIRLTQGGAAGAATDDIVLEAGTGLSIARSSDKITFTNTVSDTNTNQLTEFTLTGDSGSNQTIAHGNTLDIAGGNAISTVVGATDTVTINHDDTSSQASVNNSGTTFIQDVTLDTYGHVTGLTSVDIPVLNQDTTGSAATLTTARNIAGVAFDGSANISLNNNAITNGAGYTTNTGDITGVTAGTNLSGGGASGAVTINLADASTSAKGAASFSSDNFAVSSGAVTIKAGGVDLTNEVTGVLPSANLDADTAHYSLLRQSTFNYFKSAVGGDVLYVGLQEADAENTSITNKNLPILTGVAGKLLKVFVRTAADCRLVNITVTLKQLTTSYNVNTNNAATVGVQTVTGGPAGSLHTFDFTTGLDSGTNVVGAGDMLFLGFNVNTEEGLSTANWYVTCLWEFDYS